MPTVMRRHRKVDWLELVYHEQSRQGEVSKRHCGQEKRLGFRVLDLGAKALLGLEELRGRLLRQ